MKAFNIKHFDNVLEQAVEKHYFYTIYIVLIFILSAAMVIILSLSVWIIINRTANHCFLGNDEKKSRTPV